MKLDNLDTSNLKVNFNLCSALTIRCPSLAIELNDKTIKHTLVEYVCPMFNFVPIRWLLLSLWHQSFKPSLANKWAFQSHNVEFFPFPKYNCITEQ